MTGASGLSAHLRFSRTSTYTRQKPALAYSGARSGSGLDMSDEGRSGLAMRRALRTLIGAESTRASQTCHTTLASHTSHITLPPFRRH